MTIRERLFGNDSDSEEDNMTDETTNEEESETQEDEEEEVTLVFHPDLSFDYTEHDGVAIFENGVEREFTFDVMDKSSNEIVLKDYSDSLYIRKMPMSGSHTTPTKKLAFVTIERDELLMFETTERRDKTMTDTGDAEEVEVPRSKAEEYIEENDDGYIKEDEE
jgi:hypothetical protein